MEILHHESTENKKGTTGLLKWLSEQRQAQTPESESHLLRLESDDDAVKIVTMHRSKGLEFPIVFCPFAWHGSLLPENEIVFHDANDNKVLTLDIGSNEKHRHTLYAQKERLAENLRLLYVALTRAIERCYLVWGRINTAETSALAYLFHYHRDADNDPEQQDLVTSLKQTFLDKSDKDLLDDLNHLPKKSRGAIAVLPMPAASDMIGIGAVEKAEKISFRQFSGKINADWKVSSYSYMVSKKMPADEFPDRDQQAYDDGYAQELLEDVKETTDIFSFPRGVRAGIFFHDLFEHLDFASSDPDHKKTLIENKLTAYGFGMHWLKPIDSMINKVLSIAIDKVGNETLTLASIGCQERINELEFYFPLNPVSPHQLATAFFAQSGKDIFGFPEQIETLTFPVSRGFMKGYIDLVFRYRGRYYLLDWKSNVLGTQVEDYDTAALKQIMHREYYFLQYHLYTLALHQYLRLRVPDYRYETDFGGVAYMFVRGIDPDQSQDFGIYQDIPDPGLIHSLGMTLIPGYDQHSK
jgi:exodeoxyribonuclease V beta subunit